MSTNEIIHALEMGTERIAELNALLKEDRAELARLRAENEQLKADVTRETTVCDTACMEAQRLRAEVERLCNQRDNLLKPMREQAIARAERAEAALTEAIDGVIDGGSIPDTLLVIHIPRSPVGYHVGQPVKVILPAIDAD